MKKAFIAFASAAAAIIAIAGCGNESPSMSSQERALLENSTPEIKQLFETAWAADKTDNYQSAWTNYQALVRKGLSLDQSMALQTALKSLKMRVLAAAAKGDAGAKATLDYINAESGRTGP